MLMSEALRIRSGSFGRVALLDMDRNLVRHAHPHCHVLLRYYISKDGKKVTLIERYNNSQDGIKHGEDFISGPNFQKFFEIFEIESFITIGNASDEFKEFASSNGFEIEYRESIGGYVRR